MNFDVEFLDEYADLVEQHLEAMEGPTPYDFHCQMSTFLLDFYFLLVFLSRNESEQTAVEVVDNEPNPEPEETTSGSVDGEHHCSKAINLELMLLKAKETIKKLQTRCSEKTKDISRLRAALKRSEMSKYSLQEILNDMKENKMISDEGQHILSVTILREHV